MVIQENSFKAWLKAARPVTISAAIAPVILALAIAFSDIRYFNGYYEKMGEPSISMRWIPAVLCLLFAIIMQIDANFINDYFDWKKGVDRADRLGPKRACAQGWVTPKAMQNAIATTTLLALIVGSPLIYFGGFGMMIIGILCVIFCFLYTTVLSRYALGDILVIVFFGIIPICTTYYLQTYGLTFGTHSYSGLTYRVFYMAIAQGLVTNCLLLVNNYRDRETDKACGKRTLVVLIGETATEVVYLMLGIIAVVLCFPMMEVHKYTAVVPAIFLLPHYMTWSRMCAIRHGAELNKVLASASMCILLFAILASIGVNL